MLIGTAALGGLLVPVLRTLRPEGWLAILSLLGLSFGIGVLAGRVLRPPAWLVGGLAPAAMYLSLLTVNDLFYWHEGRLYSNGFEAFVLLLALQCGAGAIGSVAGRVGAR